MLGWKLATNISISRKKIAGIQMFRVAVAESDASEEGAEGGKCGTAGRGCNTKGDVSW